MNKTHKPRKKHKPETLSPTNSHHKTFSKFLAVLGLSKIFDTLENSEQKFPRKRSLGAPWQVARDFLFLLQKQLATPKKKDRLPRGYKAFLFPSHAIDTVTRFTKTLSATTTTTTLITITTALNILNQLVFVLRLFLYSDCYRLVRSFANWSLPASLSASFQIWRETFCKSRMLKWNILGFSVTCWTIKSCPLNTPILRPGEAFSLCLICLGMCAGMWVISRGIYLGVFQRSGHSVCLASAWLEASPTQWLCVFSCWVKLRFRGELIFPTWNRAGAETVLNFRQPRPQQKTRRPWIDLFKPPPCVTLGTSQVRLFVGSGDSR